MSNPLVIALIAVVVGVVLGMVLNPIGQHFVQLLLRRLRGVNCDISWKPTAGEGFVDSPGGRRFTQRQLTVTFENRKDVPVTVREMQVDFYKGDKPLDDQERPHVKYSRPNGGKGPFELVNLPPHIPVKRTVIVSPGHDEHRRQQAVEEADRIEFVAEIEGTKTISTRLAPWDEPTPQETNC